MPGWHGITTHLQGGATTGAERMSQGQQGQSAEQHQRQAVDGEPMRDDAGPG
jgi:hypothetical protein